MNAQVMTPLDLQVRGVSKAYPGVKALRNVDLDIRGASILGLLGPNGAGKSTLLKVLGGVEQPDSGIVSLDGRRLQISSPRAARELGIAFVNQELTDVPNLTVAENIQLGLGLDSTLSIVRTRRLVHHAQQIMDRLDPTIDVRRQAASLSVAHRRMVMIARGLAASARVLILDEPSASLSDAEISKLHAVLRNLTASGVAVVYVSHRLEEVMTLTDRYAVMRDGCTVAGGDTSAISREDLVEAIAGDQQIQGGSRRAARPPVDLSGEPLLQTENLSDHQRVRDINLTIHAGQIVGLAGLVGSGRTELARLVAGVDKAKGGASVVNGRRLPSRGPRSAIKAGIVLLPEDRKAQGLILDFSVRENMSLATLPSMRWRRWLPIPSGRREVVNANSLCEELGVRPDRIGARAGTLSGGNQQKVVLAKWIKSPARIFLFDEPTHGIDVAGKADVYRVMRDLASRGAGILFISSEFNELVSNCDRIYVMREGRIVTDFAREEISERALVQACYGTEL